MGVNQMMPTQPMAARESRLVRTTWLEAPITTTPWATTKTHGQIVEKNQVMNSAMTSWWLRHSRRASGGQSLRRLLADKLTDLLEFRRAGPAAPFEQCGFGRGQSRAGRIHAAERDIVIDLSSRADRIGGHIDVETFAQQIVNCLTDADMRLDAADEDFPNSAIAPVSEDLAALAAAKRRLRRN